MQLVHPAAAVLACGLILFVVIFEATRGDDATPATTTTTPSPTPTTTPLPGDGPVCAGVDLKRGKATVTIYDADAGKGTFGTNGKATQYNKIKAAVPYRWYTTASGSGGALGLCDAGFVASAGHSPMLQGSLPCYRLTKSNGATADIMVVETCGGTCFNSTDTGVDCATLGPGQYDAANRAFPMQQCPHAPEGIGGASEWLQVTHTLHPSGPFHSTEATCADVHKFKDWCSGFYAHFDVNEHAKWSDNSKLSPNNEVVDYERISCS